MEFGKYLNEKMNPEWEKSQYIDYNLLLVQIKEGYPHASQFTQIFREELSKVQQFFTLQEEFLSSKFNLLKLKVDRFSKPKKKEFCNIYQEIDALKVYAHLNFHGFGLVVNEQKKAMPRHVVDHDQILKSKTFFKSGTLLDMFGDMESLYTKAFGDEVTKEDLAKVLKQTDSFWKKLKNLITPTKNQRKLEFSDEDGNSGFSG
eukprot:TRINITY_DN779895_c0_g1_i1.p1 TRINITY_DN779895_c0_g1~~TRINITY_DN779895_c0_g1_i1.p1  ORF type:complete len:203 (+),score=44.88 TRINITY_DN779895_c0_g1_i1:43-651(+)